MGIVPIVVIVTKDGPLGLQGDKVCKEKPRAADIYLGQL